MAFKKKLEFTGERLIPEINKGAAFFYEHLVRYLFTSQFVKEKIVLDAGCGVGYGSSILAKYGKAKKIYAVDISKETIDYAKVKYLHKTIKFSIDNIEKLTTILDKSINIVTSFEVIEHLKDQNKFLKQVKRVLKNNGLFIVSTPNKYTYPEGNPFHTKELYPEKFYKLLKKYFKRVRFYHQGFELSQIIKPEKAEKFSLEEEFINFKTNLYTHPANLKKSQYIIAVCSDYKLPNIDLYSINSIKVDTLNFETGILSISKYINNLQSQLQQQQSHIQSLETQLNTIKSAKFFRLWQSYCKIRDKILGRKI
jgi:2-polyprenyl-3-methyl-5-hydroxy-6-metoxy-1,4-benzoquinol methylase